MNMWARYDEEDTDIVHFSAQVGVRNKSRRLVASVHIDDLELMFCQEDSKALREKLENEQQVYCWIKLSF